VVWAPPRKGGGGGGDKVICDGDMYTDTRSISPRSLYFARSDILCVSLNDGKRRSTVLVRVMRGIYEF